MSILWISLPTHLDLQDVQAALNVVVTVLSAFAIFVFARVCWQTATAKVVQNRNVPLAALLSVNTLGEVYDVCRLLGLELMSSYYLRILAQCVVVTGLTVVAFASGPIVRYSTRLGTRMSHRTIPGLLANRLQSGIAHEGVLWNNTWESLNQANFPETQLLDFLPNLTSHWKYIPSQWNSSWSLSCVYTEETPISLEAVETTCDENVTVNNQIPALEEIYPENAFWKDTYSYTYNSAEGFQNSTSYRWSEILMFRTGFTFNQKDNASEIWTDMTLTLVSIHMRGVPGTPYNETWCSYAPGPIEFATYTKSLCTVKKTRETTPTDEFYVSIAFPDHYSLDYLVKAYTTYFQGRYSREVIAKSPITVITPSNLTRFYQVYQATQDTQFKHPATRKLDLELEVVMISTIFLILSGLCLLLCIFGAIRYSAFTIRNYKAVDRTPQSKLDWMIQSIEKSQYTQPGGGGGSGYQGLQQQPSPYTAGTTPLIPGAGGSPGGKQSKFPRHSVTSLRSSDVSSPTIGRRRSDFETATYGSSPDVIGSASASANTPYHMSWLSRQGSAGGGYFPLQEQGIISMSGDMGEAGRRASVSEERLLERWPTAPAGPLGYSNARGDREAGFGGGGGGGGGGDYYVPR